MATSNIYTKEQLEKRGWDEEKISTLLDKPYKEGDKRGWNRKQIRKIEKYEEFINFVGAEQFLQKKKEIILHQEEMTLQAVAQLKIVQEKHNHKSCLLSNLEKYKENGVLNKEIIHFNNDKKLADDDTYQMFTDGCLKVVGNTTFISCAGWIKNSRNEIIVEFAKEIDKENLKSAYDFEIFGIATGIAIAKQLNLQNIECFTDSSGEAKILSFAKGGYTQDRVLELPHIYQPVIAHLKELNAQIYYIPREYNQHADELTKIHMLTYKEKEERLKIDQKKAISEKGFDYDYSEKHIYFIHPKMKHSEFSSDNSKWMLVCEYAQKNYYNFLVNTETFDFHLLSQNKKNDLLKINQESSKHGDSQAIVNINKALCLLGDIKILSIANVSSGIKVMLQNLIPIRQMFKKEMFELHKALDNFDDVHFVTAPPEITHRIRKYVINNLVEENTNSKKIQI